MRRAARHIAGLLQGCLLEPGIGDKWSKTGGSADARQPAGGRGRDTGAFAGGQYGGAASEPGQRGKAGSPKQRSPVKARSDFVIFDFRNGHARLT
jgi:hypothetical protein